MLAQTPRAILMRNLRARRRQVTPPKPRGRKTDYAKHARLVEAYEHAKAKGDHALDRLVIREGYAHRDSLLKGYRWALKALSKSTHPHRIISPSAGARGLLRSSAMAERRFFVVDFRKEWTRQPYITLWGADHCGYNWSLSHAGRYTAEQLDANVGYTTNRRYVPSRSARVGPWERFGVPCEVLERLAADPDTEGRWRLDNGGGPIVRNSADVRKLLTANRYVPKRAPLPPTDQSAGGGR